MNLYEYIQLYYCGYITEFLLLMIVLRSLNFQFMVPYDILINRCSSVKRSVMGKLPVMGVRPNYETHFGLISMECDIKVFLYCWSVTIDQNLDVRPLVAVTCKHSPSPCGYSWRAITAEVWKLTTVFGLVPLLQYIRATMTRLFHSRTLCHSIKETLQWTMLSN